MLSYDGNFQSDSNSDGLGDGWSSSGATSLSMTNNEQNFTPTVQYGRIIHNFSRNAGEVIYVCAYIKSSTTSIFLQTDNGGSNVNVSYSNLGSYQFLSAQYTANGPTDSARIVYGLTAGFSNISTKLFYVFNLTAIFGAGKELSKTQMDTFMQAQASYFVQKEYRR